jgi:hypothetical protein
MFVEMARRPVHPSSAANLETLDANQNPPTGAALNRPNHIVNAPGDFTVNAFDLRVDQTLTASQKIFGRFTSKIVDSTGRQKVVQYDAGQRRSRTSACGRWPPRTTSWCARTRSTKRVAALPTRSKNRDIRWPARVDFRRSTSLSHDIGHLLRGLSDEVDGADLGRWCNLVIASRRPLRRRHADPRRSSSRVLP